MLGLRKYSRASHLGTPRTSKGFELKDWGLFGLSFCVSFLFLPLLEDKRLSWWQGLGGSVFLGGSVCEGDFLQGSCSFHALLSSPSLNSEGPKIRWFAHRDLPQVTPEAFLFSLFPRIPSP